MAEKSEQLIISLGREFGSGGHEIADKLAEHFNLPLYDSNLLREIAEHKSYDYGRLEKYDERPKKRLFSRRVRGFSNSNEENIAKMQFDFLRERAAGGDSFVIVGRCAETVLKGTKGLVSIFINADMSCKVERVMKRHNIHSREEAQSLIKRKNIKRKHYHNYYCDSKWGDSRNYDISINTSRLGLDKTIELLITFINERMDRMAESGR